MKTITIFPGVFLLNILFACGGGGGGSGNSSPGPASPASTLSYQNPGPTGFRLVKNATSSNTHLVLDLIGPTGTQAKGVAFFLAADDTKVNWGHPSGVSGTYITPGDVFPLGNTPQLLKDKVEGGQLQVGLFQKGGTATTLGDAPILSLALDLKGAAVTGAVRFGPQSGKQAVLLNADGTLSDITLSVGVLSAQ